MGAHRSRLVLVSLAALTSAACGASTREVAHEAVAHEGHGARLRRDAVPPRPVCWPDEQWVHLPMFIAPVVPGQPLDARNLVIVDEVVATLSTRADVAELRVEGHGCEGEPLPAAEERARVVVAALADCGARRGGALDPSIVLSTVGYGSGGRYRGCGCACSDIALPEGSTAGDESHEKNCVSNTEYCRTEGYRILRVEFSLRLRRCAE